MADVHKFIVDGDRFVIDVNTGSVHEIDELVYDILEDEGLKKLEDLKEELKDKYSQEEIEEAYLEIKELIDENILYTKDLYKDIAYSFEDGKDYIKALCLNIAHDCNLRCKYCFADEGEYRGKREFMSFEVGKKAIDFVIEHSGPRKNIEVDLFGGEPLMVFDTVKKIVEYGRKAGEESGKIIRFTMTTNCTLLTDEMMDYLNENMVNIVLSLDGRKEVNDKVRVRRDGSGSYDLIVPKIKKMIQKRDSDKAYYVRGTFTRENIDFSQDLIFLANEGFKEISIEPVVLPEDHPLSIRKEDLENISKEYEKIYRELLKRKKENKEINFYHFNINLDGGPCVYKRISGCGAGHEYVAVTPNGDIYPCHQFVGNEDFKIGNIFNETMREDIGKTFKKAHIYNKPKCKECWARFYCSGGCQANNYNFNKDFNTPYEIGCIMQKKRIECAIALKSQNNL